MKKPRILDIYTEFMVKRTWKLAYLDILSKNGHSEANLQTHKEIDMMKQVNFRQLKMTGAIATLLLGVSVFGLSLKTQAQDQVSQDQDT
ncbi:MAG: hypothetical protein ACRDEA_16540, partial [Microcystaceae cyanobacterium]